MGKIYASKISTKNIFSRFMDQKRITKLGYRGLIFFIMAIGLIACKEKVENNLEVQVYEEPVFVEPDVYEFGFNLNDGKSRIYRNVLHQFLNF